MASLIKIHVKKKKLNKETQRNGADLTLNGPNVYTEIKKIKTV